MSILSSTKTGKKAFYTLFPKSKYELLTIIRDEIKQNGNECSLNHIDTSKITDMSYLFSNSELVLFDGNISMWDISNVSNTTCMFYGSGFTGKNGDISNWDVSKVTDMSSMFYSSKYNGNLSKWNVSNVKNMNSMFCASDFTGENGDISNWDVSNVENMTFMFEKALFNGDISNWNIKSVKSIHCMFSFSKITIPPKNWDIKNLFDLLSCDEYAYLYNIHDAFTGTYIEANNIVPEWYVELKDICKRIFNKKEGFRKFTMRDVPHAHFVY